VILATVFFLVAGTWMLFRSGTATHERADPGVTQVDRLYYDMGILGIPNIVPTMEIILEDLDGNRAKLSDLRGKVVFLNFWATWCPACRVEMPSMEELHQRLRERDFAMVAISMQEPAPLVRDYFEKHNLSFTALLDPDGQIGSRFGVVSIPTTYILNRQGGIIGKAVGAREWYSRDAVDLFEHLIEVGISTPSANAMP